MMPLSIFSVDLLSENLILLVSVLVFAAVLVAKVGSKLGAPSLLLFLLLGVVAGPDVLGMYFDDLRLAEFIGHLSMSVILFTAGLETSFAETRPVFWKGVLLSTVGVFLTVGITGGVMSFTGIPLMACFLVAAIMSSTDSASVFGVLREKRLRLKENLGPMLELESGSNDPIALTLTVILVHYFTSGGAAGQGPWAALGQGFLDLLLQIGVGLAIGFLVGFGAKWIIGKLESANYAITTILILSLGFFANGIAEYLSGNGLLATYTAAIIIGNQVKLQHKKEIYRFFDGLTWMMQMMMFLILGLLARPSQMPGLILPALGLCLFMMLVARPLSVYLCMLPFRKGLSFRARTFVSWVGLKGAGPILFALYAMVHGLDYSMETFNLVFLLSLFSLLLQGGSLGFMARKLHVSYEEEEAPETFGMEIPDEMGMLRDHLVTEEDLQLGATLRDLHLPHGIRVMMIRREGRFLVPHGSMPLKVGDHLVIIMGDTDD